MKAFLNSTLRKQEQGLEARARRGLLCLQVVVSFVAKDEKEFHHANGGRVGSFIAEIFPVCLE
jgi:hypothetical protein